MRLRRPTRWRGKPARWRRRRWCRPPPPPASSLPNSANFPSRHRPHRSNAVIPPAPPNCDGLSMVFAYTVRQRVSLLTAYVLAMTTGGCAAYRAAHLPTYTVDSFRNSTTQENVFLGAELWFSKPLSKRSEE